MVCPPLWLWIVAGAVTLLGLRFSRLSRVDRQIARLPVWFCALLVLAGFVGMWYLLNAQLGGLAFRLSVP